MKLNLHTNDKAKTLTCKQDNDNLDKYATAVVEGEPLDITIGYKNKTLNYIKCEPKEKPDNTFVIKETSFSSANPIPIPNVDKNMEGIWNCTILANKNLMALTIKPIVYHNGDRYTAVYCFIKVTVIPAEPPNKILVNGIVLPTNRIPVDILLSKDNELSTYTSQYNYSNGDKTDVFCFNDNLNCDKVKLVYDYAGKLDDILKNDKLFTSDLGIGFKTSLKPEHDNSFMICECITKKYVASINITFKWQEQFDTFRNITMNGYPLRMDGITKYGVPLLNMTYKTLRNLPLNIIYEAKNFDITINESGTCQKTLQPVTNTNRIHNLTVATNKECVLKYTVGSKDVVVETLELQLSKRPKRFNKPISLSMDFSNYDNVFEVYRYGEYIMRSIYYGYYQEKENITVTCSKTVPAVGPPTYIEFNGTDMDNSRKSLTLSSLKDNTQFECYVRELETNDLPKTTDKIHGHIQVIFRKRAPEILLEEDPPLIDENDTSAPENSTRNYSFNNLSSTHGHRESDPFFDQQLLFIIAAVGVLIIVLVCVTILLWRMKKRTRKTNTPATNYEHLNAETSTSIPPHPKQWTHDEEVNYQVPVDRRTDHVIYAEPIKEDCYATPIPKSKRNTKHIPETTYAELNLSQNNSSKKYTESDKVQYASVGDLYSQVVPKSSRNKNNAYDNIFSESRYVNSGETEYVEPTYSPAYRQ